MNTAPFFALALLASIAPAHAQVPTPAAGYHSIEIPNRPQPRPTAPPAARARDQRDISTFNRVVPEGAGDPNDPVLSRPHVLLLSVHPNTTDMSAGKTPTPSADTIARRGMPFIFTGIFPDRQMKDFGDWWACNDVAQWWLADSGPTIVRAECKPFETVRKARGAKR